MMKVALVLALIGAPAVAHAGSGGFVALGVGGTANVGGELGSFSFEGEGKAGSLFVGQRFGNNFGLEVGLSRYGLAVPNATWTNTGLAAAGRFTLPFSPMMGGYLRAGIEKTWMKPDGTRGDEFSGTGWLASLGFEYKLDIGKVSGTVWADLTRHDGNFVSDQVERAGNIDIVQLGISVGF